MAKLTDAVRFQLAQLVQQKRNLQQEISRVREDKKRQIAQVNNGIKYTKDKTQKANLRNQKTRINEQCETRINSIRYQIQGVESQTRSIRSRGW